MEQFFRPYEGRHPFLFISYAHACSTEVLPVIRILHDGGVRLWYDEGIPAGSDWPANIADHMQSCERVLFFLHERALRSPNCFSEIRTAARLKKPLLVVRLDSSPIPAEWAELLDEAPTVELQPDAAARAEAIRRSGFVPRRLRHSWGEKIPWRALGLAASLALFLASAALFGAAASGRFQPLSAAEMPAVTQTPAPFPTPVPELPEALAAAESFFPVSFPDTRQETAIRRALGRAEGEISRGELAGIRSLHLAGNLILSDPGALRFEADGSARVNGAPVSTGKVTDLSLLPYMTRLEELTLACQPLQSLTPLAGHVLLRQLNLAGSTVTELGALTGLPSLETLQLEHTGVKDLSPLEALPSLGRVTVSRDMLPLSWSGDAAFEVILVQ